MQEGWLCPLCGKAHGPHIATCPVTGTLPPYVPPGEWATPRTFHVELPLVGDQLKRFEPDAPVGVPVKSDELYKRE